MSETDQQIRDRIEEFVNQLNQLVRQTALESVRDALGGGGGGSAPRGRGRRGPGRPAARGSRRKGEKRSPDQIAETTKAVLELREEAPGPGCRSHRQGPRQRHQRADLVDSQADQPTSRSRPRVRSAPPSTSRAELAILRAFRGGARLRPRKFGAVGERSGFSDHSPRLPSLPAGGGSVPSSTSCRRRTDWGGACGVVGASPLEGGELSLWARAGRSNSGAAGAFGTSVSRAISGSGTSLVPVMRRPED